LTFFAFARIHDRNTKNQIKPFLRPSSAPRRAGSLELTKSCQPTRSWRTIQFFMKSSTRDKIEGAFKEVKGKVKEETGKAKRNPDLRDRGTAEKTGGKVQRKIGDVKKVFEQ
jgi:uncharacterized protein YjbJ (UPF0337 family)